MTSTPPTTPPTTPGTWPAQRDGDVSREGAMAGDGFPPRELAEYRIVRLLGQGGNGRVYLAEDTVLRRPVAIKFMTRDDRKGRERFLVEARAAARLQHPNVAQIYRVGELDSRPYLVSEYVQGASLDALPRPVTMDRALALGIEIARGLAALHQRGVLHRDIKPANIVVSQDGMPSKPGEPGEAKLVDLGLAKLVDEAMQGDSTPSSEHSQTNPAAPGVALPASIAGVTERGELLGTRYYMAPEMWRNEAATPATDVYSLGVVLYELCTGYVPHHDVPRGELARVTQERDSPRLDVVLPGANPRLAAIVNRCLAREPGARFGSGAAVRDELEALVDREMTAPEGNPYRGLRPFEAEHRAFFFGRDADVREILDRLRAGPLVLLAGDSGVGKSSLARAGVVPRVAEGGLGDGRDISVCSMVPGRRPLSALAAALAARMDTDEVALAAMLERDAGEVSALIRRHHGESLGTLLFIDQLEETLTLAEPDQARAFSEALAALAAGTPGMHILGTVRGDRVTALARLPGLGAMVERALYIVLPPGEDGIRDSIVRPARIQGARFESDALVADLVASAAEGGLPLLQFALTQLWEARDGDVISAAALQRIGGVEGALSQHADRVIREMLPARREAARSMLVRLVTSHGTRARLGDEELALGDPDRRAALDALVEGRLLVASQGQRAGDGEAVYEIAHEALISGWATLRGWLDQDSSARAVRERIAAAAAEWARLGRRPEALWRGRQLGEARDIDGVEAHELAPVEAEFLAASRRVERRARWLRRAIPALLFLLAGLIYGGFRYKDVRDRERRAEELTAKVNQQVSQAEIDIDRAREHSRLYDKAREQAFAHFEQHEPGARMEGEKAWSQAIASLSSAEDSYARAMGPLEHAFRLDPARADVRGHLARVLYERAVLAERSGRETTRDELVERLALYDDTGELTKRFRARRPVSWTTAPEPGHGTLHRYRQSEERRLVLEDIGPVRAPGGQKLEPGSYLLVFSANGRTAEVRYPFRVAPGIEPGEDAVRLHVDLPAVDDVPEGFVYVAAGTFLYGYGGDATDERIRVWYQALPLHERATGAYLIGRHEATYADWIAFLRSLPAGARGAHLPRADEGAGHARIELIPQGDDYVLYFRPASKEYTASTGELIQYTGRALRAMQDWQKFPVTGVSGNGIQAFLRWYGEHRGVQGARLCREDEWERAARGADGRLHAHGNVLEPGDANFDLTYGRIEEAFGLDEIGSYAQTRSPFGLEDTIGNAREITESLFYRDVFALCGGTYFNDMNTAEAPNRDTMARGDQTLPRVGFRVCADAPEPLRR
jgi:eukaryotic-like serine/threonine-protein kinase